jgi:cytochrome b pre-mRNA-processing protein 3
MINIFSKRNRAKEVGEELYRIVLAQARSPKFYSDWGVADTVDGRFEMISLHAFLVLHRLKQEDFGEVRLGQVLFDAMFRDFDRALREMGAGDLGVGKRVKKMAKAFYGRISAFEKGLDNPGILHEAILRNIYRGDEIDEANADAMADYVLEQVSHLASLPAEEFSSNKFLFSGPV